MKKNRRRLKILIIGVGNILYRDDGLGVVVIEELKKMNWPVGVKLIEVGTAPLYFLTDIGQAENLLVIDIIKGEQKPGTIYQLEYNEVIDNPHKNLFKIGNTHGFTLLEVINLAREIYNYPENTFFFGIEPVKTDPGISLSRVVCRKIPALTKIIKQKTEQLL